MENMKKIIEQYNVMSETAHKLSELVIVCRSGKS